MLSLRRRQRAAPVVELNVIPLIDVVFFLLVFYVMTTSVEAVRALPVERPVAAATAATAPGAVPVTISADGGFSCGGRAVDEAGLAAAVAEAITRGAEARVLVVADRAVPTGRLVAAMDACRSGGALAIDLAADRPEDGAP
jgi:biopolymer transport protein ExbD